MREARTSTAFTATSRGAILLVATLSFIYMGSQVLRNSIGVIAPDLATEVGLSAGQLGLLSSVFFVAFALAQVPLGMALDRFGPKRCMLVCAVIAVLGSLLFARANSPEALTFARALMGVGCSCYLMAPLTLYARSFPPERFSTLAGVQLGLGTIGTLIATAPLAVSAAHIGWRGSFVALAAGMALAGIMVALVVPRGQGGSHVPRESLRETLAGTRLALRAQGVVRLFVMQLTAYSSFVLIVGLWGGPYLTHLYGYNITERGNFLFLAVLGQIAGLMLAGPLERRMRSHKAPVMLGSGITAGLFLVLGVLGTLPVPALVLWLLLLGLASAYNAVLIAHGKTLFPPHLVGRGMTLLNVGSMFGVFVSQTATGALINLFPQSSPGAYPELAYRAIFALQGLALVLSMAIYRGAPDPVHHARSTAKV